MTKPTKEEVEAEKENQARSYLIKNLKKRIQELTDSHDMLNDELLRIKSCPDATSEIKGLCDRALKDIKRNVPLIDENENLRNRILEQSIDLTALEAYKPVDVGAILNDIKSDIYPSNIGDYLDGIRCGVEDRELYDRYECAEYGYEQALEYALSCVPDLAHLIKKGIINAE